MRATLDWSYELLAEPERVLLRRPLVATALFAAFHSGYAIALYILACAVISFIATALLPDYTNRDVSQEYDV